MLEHNSIPKSLSANEIFSHSLVTKSDRNPFRKSVYERLAYCNLISGQFSAAELIAFGPVPVSNPHTGDSSNDLQEKLLTY